MKERETGSSIQAENISLAIGAKSILKSVSLKAGREEYIALLGPNGAGKSTLLKILSGLLQPSSGRVGIRGSVGFLSHRSFLYERLSAWENLKFYGSLYEVPDLGQRIQQVVEMVGLYHFLHEPVFTFSRGMSQRLAIARAILHDPAVLLLDEPYTGLDQKGAALLDGILLEMHRLGKTVFLVTHNLEQGLEPVNRILILNRGKKVYDALRNREHDPAVREIYHDQVDSL